MDLTVIIACQDREKNIELCLSSIRENVPLPELIVVDFNSKNSLLRFKPIFPWATFIRTENNAKIFHKTRALNIGIKAAKTTFVCLTDADQVFQNNFFGEVYKAVQEQKSFVMCSTLFLDKLPGSDLCARNYSDFVYTNLLALAKKSKKHPHGEGCCHGVSREWLMSVGGHDERYIGWGFEDKDLYLRAMHAGFQEVRINKTTTMVHLPHEREVKYFNKAFRLANEARFNHKRNAMELIANTGREWGCL
jgi:GT2 family glycosyltransferase